MKNYNFKGIDIHPTVREYFEATGKEIIIEEFQNVPALVFKVNTITIATFYPHHYYKMVYLIGGPTGKTKLGHLGLGWQSEKEALQAIRLMAFK